MPSVLSQSLMAACAFGNAKQEAARTSHPAVIMKKNKKTAEVMD